MRSSLAFLFVSGCALSQGAFGHRFPDNRSSDLDAVVGRLEAAPVPSHHAVLVGVASDPVGLYAYDLDANRLAFRRDEALGTVPHVAGDYVVTEEGEDAVVRRLTDGVETARVPRRGLRLVGAAGEAGLGLLVLSTTSGAVAESVLVVLRDGGAGTRMAVEQALGEPAVRAGMLFVPWGHQNVSVIDGETEAEIARLRVPSVVGHAIARGNDVFIGQSELARFGSHLVGTPTWLTPSDDERSSGAHLYDDAYAPPPNASSAAHHVRMAVGPVAAEGEAGVGLSGGALYEIFYRAVFALEGTGGAARWARTVEHDIVGASVEESGLLLADEAGGVVLLDAESGLPRFTLSTGIASSYVAFHAEGFSPSGGTTGALAPLRDQLLSVAADTDARLVPARAFAVRLLGSSPEPEVTNNLIALCEDRSAAPSVHTAACDALSARSVGAESILEALGRHAAFLAGSSAPPVGALAQAAARMEERRAVAPLVAQLRDPATPAADLAPIFEALTTLGDATILEAIADWLRLYHAEPDESELSAALAAAVTTYTTLAGPTAADLLQPLIDDPMTNAVLREQARTALTPPEAPAEPEPEPRADAETRARPERARARVASAVVGEPSDNPLDAGTVTDVPEPVPPSRGELVSRADSEEARERALAARARSADDEDDEDHGGAGPEEDDELPAHLTSDMIREAVTDFRRELRDCLVTPRLTHGSARVVLVIEPNGSVLMVHTVPTEIQACVEPLMRSASYPATRARSRQTVTYEIRR